MEPGKVVSLVEILCELEKRNIRYLIPSVEDLIALKKLRKPTAKDRLDIEFPESLRNARS